ncbi:hypothetical protein [Mesoplasma melaleucae]|uniref:Uncharacterized protein n=1 Tax=Mesoplasma melaleucae TaxID=81459 RepID=A0A2K8NWC2_9MOLU|nr:hypothetical protein [Mesoplasma melaleucae]ATZ18034.1 hypothetical protein EMELA_v1c04940 [Mesoplasma melaleucae]
MKKLLSNLNCIGLTSSSLITYPVLSQVIKNNIFSNKQNNLTVLKTSEIKSDLENQLNDFVFKSQAEAIAKIKSNSVAGLEYKTSVRIGKDKNPTFGLSIFEVLLR